MANRTAQQLSTFIFMGITIAILLGLLIVFAYVVLWGVLLGIVFWLCALVKRYFTRSSATPSSDDKKQGRVIDYDEYK